jgi:putative lipoprotein
VGLALCACAGPGTLLDPTQHVAAVSGTITYRERVALRAGAFVVVQLQDISRPDAPGIVVGEQRIDSPGQVPIRFEIRYDPARIDPERIYAISACIFQGDRPLFINDTTYHVITRGNPSQIEMVLRFAR